MRRLVLGLIFAFLTCDQVNATDSFVLNTWFGSSYSDPGSGKFSQCAAYSPFPGGISLSLRVDRYYNWALGLSHPEWHMTGPVVSLLYRFDGGPWVTGSGLVQGPKFALLKIPAGENLINFLRHRDVMELQLNGDEFYLELKDSPTILSRLASCYRQQAIAPRPYLMPLCRTRQVSCNVGR